MTKQGKKYYDAIKRYIAENGCSPTYEEICKLVGVRSLASAHKAVERLVRDGYLSQQARRGRTINIIPNKLHGFNACDRNHVKIYFEVSACPLCEEIQRRLPPREVTVG